MKKWTRTALTAVALLAAMPLPGRGQEAGSTPDQPVQPNPVGNAAISQIRSPFCPGLMLEVCPSPQAALLRDTIQKMAWAGVPEDTLVSWVLARYGQEYRAVPQTQGRGLLAWVMPPLGLLLGLVLTVLALRHFRTGKDDEESGPGLSPEEENELKEAMAELKASEEFPF